MASVQNPQVQVPDVVDQQLFYVSQALKKLGNPQEKERGLKELQIASGRLVTVSQNLAGSSKYATQENLQGFIRKGLTGSTEKWTDQDALLLSQIVLNNESFKGSKYKVWESAREYLEAVNPASVKEYDAAHPQASVQQAPAQAAAADARPAAAQAAPAASAQQQAAAPAAKPLPAGFDPSKPLPSNLILNPAAMGSFSGDFKSSIEGSAQVLTEEEKKKNVTYMNNIRAYSGFSKEYLDGSSRVETDKLYKHAAFMGEAAVGSAAIGAGLYYAGKKMAATVAAESGASLLKKAGVWVAKKAGTTVAGGGYVGGAIAIGSTVYGVYDFGKAGYRTYKQYQADNYDYDTAQSKMDERMARALSDVAKSSKGSEAEKTALAKLKAVYEGDPNIKESDRNLNNVGVGLVAKRVSPYAFISDAVEKHVRQNNGAYDRETAAVIAKSFENSKFAQTVKSGQALAAEVPAWANTAAFVQFAQNGALVDKNTVLAAMQSDKMSKQAGQAQAAAADLKTGADNLAKAKEINDKIVSSVAGINGLGAADPKRVQGRAEILRLVTDATKAGYAGDPKPTFLKDLEAKVDKGTADEETYKLAPAALAILARPDAPFGSQFKQAAKELNTQFVAENMPKTPAVQVAQAAPEQKPAAAVAGADPAVVAAATAYKTRQDEIKALAGSFNGSVEKLASAKKGSPEYASAAGEINKAMARSAEMGLADLNQKGHMVKPQAAADLESKLKAGEPAEGLLKYSKFVAGQIQAKSGENAALFNAGANKLARLVNESVPMLSATAPAVAATASAAPAVAAAADQKRPEPKVEAKPIPVVAPAVEKKPEPKAEAKPVSVAAPAVEKKPEPKAEAKPAPVAEKKPEPKAEAKPAPVAEKKPEPKAEAKPAPAAEKKPEPKAEAKPAQISAPAGDPIGESRIVAKGESLWKIVTEMGYSGEERFAVMAAIYAKNEGKFGGDPHKIKVGSKLEMPNPQQVEAAHPDLCEQMKNVAQEKYLDMRKLRAQREAKSSVAQNQQGGPKAES